MHTIKRGLDLPIAGTPVQSIEDGPAVARVALLGADYIGLKPTMLVEPGDTVLRGQPVFEDKKLPGVRHTAPAAGRVSAIHRGDKRAFVSLEIDVAPDDGPGQQVAFPAWKYGPPFMPVSLRDQAGREFSRVYSDRFGMYNALVPSTFSYNIPIPSGVSPNMIQACLNSPYMPDPANPGQFTLDPHFNKSYTQFCYTFQYLPGTTTYLDTPVLPIAAFAGPQQFPLDCEAPSTTLR